MIAWSYSRLSDYESCPKMFEAKNITKTVKFVGNAATERGKKLHKALERDVIRVGHGRPFISQELLHVKPIIEGFVKLHPQIATEQQLAFKVDLGVCDWFDKDVWLRAIIDVEGCMNPFSKLQDHKYSIITGRLESITTTLTSSSCTIWSYSCYI